MGVYLKNKSWYIDYYLPSGTRKREVVGKSPAVTQRDAEKALRTRQAEIYQGRYNIESTKKPILFDKFVNDEYLPWAKDHYEDFARVKSVTKLFLQTFKNMSFQDMNNWLVDKYKSKRKKLGKDPETINRELTVLHKICTLAVEWKKILSNPIKGMKKLKVPYKKKRKLKDWEFKLLYDSAEEHLKPILLCCYVTGMRKNEIRELTWKCVDLEEKKIYLIKTKNNESRTIPIDEALLKTLINIRKTNRSEFVFLSAKGEPYRSKKAWDGSFKKALKKSGIEYCTFHDIRRTCISNLLVDEKVDIRTVMEISGHKDIRMLKIYAHSDEDAKKKAVSKLDVRIKEMGIMEENESQEVQQNTVELKPVAGE